MNQERERGRKEGRNSQWIRVDVGAVVRQEDPISDENGMTDCAHDQVRGVDEGANRAEEARHEEPSVPNRDHGLDVAAVVAFQEVGAHEADWRDGHLPDVSEGARVDDTRQHDSSACQEDDDRVLQHQDLEERHDLQLEDGDQDHEGRNAPREVEVGESQLRPKAAQAHVQQRQQDDVSQESRDEVQTREGEESDQQDRRQQVVLV